MPERLDRQAPALIMQPCERLKHSVAWLWKPDPLVLPMINFVLAPFVILGLAGWSAPGEVLERNQARWPQFRGPGGQGIGREGLRLPVEFGPASKVIWKTPLPPGHSSPCISDDRIYLTGFD